MKRLLATLLCLCLAALSTGCAMCYTPYDDHYSAFGGVAERGDRVQGRLGSILSDTSLQFTDTTGADEAAQTDLYRLESDGPQLEAIEPLEAPSDPPNISNQPTELGDIET